jgi:hypothetical protein
LLFKRALGTFRLYRPKSAIVGASPSGKASVFGTDIRRFDPSRPSHHYYIRNFYLKAAKTNALAWFEVG